MHRLLVRLTAPLTGVRVSAAAPRAEQTAHADLRAGQQALIERLFAGVMEAVRDAEQRRRQAQAEWENAAVELAVAISSKLLFETVERGEYPIDRLVAEAAARLAPRGPLTVRLHPADLDFLSDMAQGIPPWKANPELRLVADAAVARGHCRAEANGAGLVAGWESMLTDIRRELLEGLHDEIR